MYLNLNSIKLAHIVIKISVFDSRKNLQSVVRNSARNSMLIPRSTSRTKS